MSPPEEYMLSPLFWKEQWGLGHLDEVSFGDVGSMQQADSSTIHRDPET